MIQILALLPHIQEIPFRLTASLREGELSGVTRRDEIGMHGHLAFSRYAVSVRVLCANMHRDGILSRFSPSTIQMSFNDVCVFKDYVLQGKQYLTSFGAIREMQDDIIAPGTTWNEPSASDASGSSSSEKPKLFISFNLDPFTSKHGRDSQVLVIKENGKGMSPMEAKSLFNFGHDVDITANKNADLPVFGVFGHGWHKAVVKLSNTTLLLGNRISPDTQKRERFILLVGCNITEGNKLKQFFIDIPDSIGYVKGDVVDVHGPGGEKYSKEESSSDNVLRMVNGLPLLQGGSAPILFHKNFDALLQDLKVMEKDKITLQTFVVLDDDCKLRSGISVTDKKPDIQDTEALEGCKGQKQYLRDVMSAWFLPCGDAEDGPHLMDHLAPSLRHRPDVKIKVQGVPVDYSASNNEWKKQLDHQRDLGAPYVCSPVIEVPCMAPETGGQVSYIVKFQALVWKKGRDDDVNDYSPSGIRCFTDSGRAIDQLKLQLYGDMVDNAGKFIVEAFQRGA